MSKLFGAALAAALATALVSVVPAAAQQPAPATPAPATPAPATPAPASSGVVATTNNPNLAVATLKLENGTRLSKVIGSSVYNETNDKIGAVDDLIMTTGDKVTMAIVSVGGFLGIGSKLVAVPWSQLRLDGDKTVMAGANKDTLNATPSFQY